MIKQSKEIKVKQGSKETTNFVYGKRVFVDTFERQLLLNLIDIKCPCEDGEKYIETFGQTWNLVAISYKNMVYFGTYGFPLIMIKKNYRNYDKALRVCNACIWGL